MRGRLTFKTIVNADALIEKTQRVNGRSTKVSLLFSRKRERGHYEPEPARNQGFGAIVESESECEPGPYSVQRRNNNAPFVPPKPNEFDMAYSSSALRAKLGTRSMPAVSGSGFSRLIVGG